MENGCAQESWQARKRVHRRHLERLERQQAQQVQIDRRFVRLRLVLLVLILAAGGLTFWPRTSAYGLPALVATIGMFAGVVIFHRRLDRVTLRFRHAYQLTHTQLARLELDWTELPPLVPAVEAEQFDLENHPFASDLNIVGEHSLHRLLDTSLSLGGSRRLRAWLLNPSPDPVLIHRRQGMVQALLPMNSFRRRLERRGALAAGKSGGRWDGEALLAWLRARVPERSGLGYLLLLGTLALTNLVLFGLYLGGRLPALWLGSLVVYGWLLVLKQRETGPLFEQAATLHATLDQIRAVLTFLEAYPCSPGGELEALCAALRDPGRRPSQVLRRLNWLLSAASLRYNPIWALLLNTLLPWDYLLYFLFNRQKSGLLRSLPAWLDSWYEIEALNSLANFAYLFPAYTFPVLHLESRQEPVLAAVQIGHPLIPLPQRRCNNFTLAGAGEIGLISGSNMSGKSTFLRTLGTNLCLAFSGAPVAAAQLETISWRVFTSMQVTDSLQDGISFFYAEVKRLKVLLEAYRQPEGWPVFFLIDEIFRGTNNRERQLGSEAYVRALAEGRGAGCLATHDLELVSLAETIPGLHNYHFRELVLDGRMVFDYALRSGPCPTTNALEIMRLEGLPTPKTGQ